MGPMVFGGAYWPLVDEERIAKMGFQGEYLGRLDYRLSRRQIKSLLHTSVCAVPSLCNHLQIARRSPFRVVRSCSPRSAAAPRSAT
jgi:hypothetical protein